MSPRRRRHPRGLTLIEITVVITIISLLSAAVAVNAMEIYRGAKVKTAFTEVHALGTALDAYAMKMGKYPTVAQGLQPLLDEHLVKELRPDPWGNDFVYSLEKGEPKVVSYGADGQPGGEGYDADIPDDRKRKVAQAE